MKLEKFITNPHFKSIGVLVFIFSLFIYSCCQTENGFICSLCGPPPPPASATLKPIHFSLDTDLSGLPSGFCAKSTEDFCDATKFLVVVEIWETPSGECIGMDVSDQFIRKDTAVCEKFNNKLTFKTEIPESGTFKVFFKVFGLAIPCDTDCCGNGGSPVICTDSFGNPTSGKPRYEGTSPLITILGSGNSITNVTLTFQTCQCCI